MSPSHQNRGSRRFLLRGLALAVVVAAATCAIRRTVFFAEAIELPVYDFSTRLCWPWQAGHPDLAMVTIKESARFEHPLRDDVLADALERILSAGPSLVGLDLKRKEYLVGADATGTERLKRIGRDERLVWLRIEAGEELAATEPPPFMVERMQVDPCLDNVASATLHTDGGWNQVIRRGPLLAWEGDQSGRYAFAALLALRHADKRSPGTEEAHGSRLFEEIGSLSRSAGGYWFPDPSGDHAIRSEYLLKPVEAPNDRFREISLGQSTSEVLADRRIPVYSLEELLHGDHDESALRQALGGKLVILATTDDTTEQDWLPVTGDPALRGSKLQALATAQLLRELEGEEPVRVLPDRIEDAMVLATSLFALAILALPGIPRMIRAGAALFGVPLGAFAVGLVTLNSGIWLPTGAPMLAGTASGLGGLLLLWRAASSERTAYLKVMSAHLGPEVTARVLARNEQLTAGIEKPPETLEATALFGDLRGYSAASQHFDEKGDVEAFFSWLNGILRPAVEITGRHGGFVKQFAGDGIFVIFGFPPETGGGHAQRAVDCARELATLVPALNRQLPDGVPRYYLRIGIYSGPVHASSVGGARHTDYSFLGPTINKAARLESIHKERFDHLERPVRILIGGGTRDHLDDPSLALAYGDGPIEIDKRLPPEVIWEISTAEIPQDSESTAS